MSSSPVAACGKLKLRRHPGYHQCITEVAQDRHKRRQDELPLRGSPWRHESNENGDGQQV
ncbi:hypothetical protein MY10362_008581 [Beauveria mimosiformis]